MAENSVETKIEIKWLREKPTKYESPQIEECSHEEFLVGITVMQCKRCPLKYKQHMFKTEIKKENSSVESVASATV